MRSIIQRATQNIEQFIPCHGNLDCHTFALPENKRPAVIAGHFDYKELRKKITQFDCITILRHPVSRFISYYYERIFPLSKRFLNDYSIDSVEGDWLEIEFYLKHFKSISNGAFRDEEISNVACKLFTQRKEWTGKIPHFSYFELARNFKLKRKAQTEIKVLNQSLVQEAAMELNKCTVGIQEKPLMTQNLLKKTFPWLKTVEFSCPGHSLRTNRKRETKSSLNEALKQRIIEHNLCDMALYDSVVAKMDSNM